MVTTEDDTTLLSEAADNLFLIRRIYDRSKII